MIRLNGPHFAIWVGPALITPTEERPGWRLAVIVRRPLLMHHANVVPLVGWQTRPPWECPRRLHQALRRMATKVRRSVASTRDSRLWVWPSEGLLRFANAPLGHAGPPWKAHRNAPQASHRRPLVGSLIEASLRAELAVGVGP